ncbi:MAG: pilus assembly protein [Actinobacteria bacterium]|nr:pilus assembly protein [Actinomycetota bacterium]
MRSTSCAGSADRRKEHGATIVEFLGVSVLTVACVLSVAQLAVWVWARDVAVTAAHEGARTAAESGRPLDDGIGRARALLRDGLGESAARFVVEAAQEGDVVAVRAHGRAPALVPFLPALAVEARATAADEDAGLP